MRSLRSIIAVVASLLASTFLLISCNNDNQERVYPRNTEHTTPGAVQVRFPKGSELPDLAFSIDNQKMRIYNSSYLPFESNVDSAYLEMIVSTEATVRILNQTTQKTIVYKGDTSKIDLTGGKLKISIEMKERPTVVYDFRLLTYGYDPFKFTWKKQSNTLPFASMESQVIEHEGKRFWIAFDEEKVGKVYEIEGTMDLTFKEKTSAILPEGFIPRSVINDHLNNYWGLTRDGMLYKSSDLMTWTLVDLAGHKLSTLIADVEQNKEKPANITGVSFDAEGNYHSCNIKDGVVTVVGQLNENFPVKDAYVYSYSIAGTMHAYILGGIMKNGKAAPRSFFTSDGVNWGITPYISSEKGQDLPMTGGLYLRDQNLADLYVLGGLYPDNKVSSTIKRSKNRGVTWAELSKEQTPNEEFAARYNASGFKIGSSNQIQFYILGGVINGTPSREIWHGWLDTTAGIINSFDN